MNPYALSGSASFWELAREIPPWRFLPLQWDMDFLEYPSKLFLSVRVGLHHPGLPGCGGFKEALMGRLLYPMILWPTLLRYTP